MDEKTRQDIETIRDAAIATIDDEAMREDTNQSAARGVSMSALMIAHATIALELHELNENLELLGTDIRGLRGMS